MGCRRSLCQPQPHGMLAAPGLCLLPGLHPCSFLFIVVGTSRPGDTRGSTGRSSCSWSLASDVGAPGGRFSVPSNSVSKVGDAVWVVVPLPSAWSGGLWQLVTVVVMSLAVFATASIAQSLLGSYHFPLIIILEFSRTKPRVTASLGHAQTCWSLVELVPE